MSSNIDPSTKRPFGDHGSAEHAIRFALDDPRGTNCGDPCDTIAFLEAWRDGSAIEEWPEFYEWLREVEAKENKA